MRRFLLIVAVTVTFAQTAYAAEGVGHAHVPAPNYGPGVVRAYEGGGMLGPSSHRRLLDGRPGDRQVVIDYVNGLPVAVSVCR